VTNIYKGLTCTHPYFFVLISILGENTSMTDFDGFPDQILDQLVDTDPAETAEWQASFDAALTAAGPVRARYLMLSLLRRAQEKNIGISQLRATDYINTISPEHEPEFPGDEAIERRIRAINRWNAAMLVHRAQRPGIGVGGHISTYVAFCEWQRPPPQ